MKTLKLLKYILVGILLISNQLIAQECTVASGIITLDGSASVCVDDGVDENLMVAVQGNTGESGWIITDDSGTILGLPPAPPFNFEGVPLGTCVIWHISSEGEIAGLATQEKIFLLEGCFDLSNPIAVSRYNTPSGGQIVTTEGNTEFTICAGDGTPDPFTVDVIDAEGENSAWVITDTDLNILGLPPGPSFDLDGAGPGTCLVWYVRYNGKLLGAEVGQNAADLSGCYDLSNPITVTRLDAPSAAEIETTDGMTEFSICAGDGSPDPFTVEVSGTDGENSAWVITDTDLNILGTPPGPSFDLDGAGPGTCLVWYVSFNGELMGAEVGQNAADLSGCYALSNPITVTRYGAPSGGEIVTTDGMTEFSICASDGSPDPFTVDVIDAEGENSAWVITDTDLNILGLPAGPTFDLDGAGPGTCLVWHLAFNGELMGAEVGQNAADLSGCYDLSNPITVTRLDAPTAGEIATTDGLTEFSICAGDGSPDPFTVEVSGADGENSAWVITDTDLNILGLPAGPTFDLDGAGAGTCLVWYVSYNGDLMGAEVGQNAADLTGCFALSNPVTVTRYGAPSGGEIVTTDGMTEFSICAGDGSPDPFTVEVSGAVGESSAWVITDTDLNILGLPAGPTFDLDGAGAGTCLVWYVSYNGDLMGAEVGQNAADLSGCYDLSNPITVSRFDAPSGGEIVTIDGQTELSICAGDGEADPFTVEVVGSDGENFAWVITDTDLNILGLPPGPTFDLDGAGAGTCLVWHLAYNGDLMGAEVGLNAGDLSGCYDLSNPITVLRSASIAAEIETTDGETELTICAGDGEADPFTVSVSGGSGDNSLWVITDESLNILATPVGPTFDLDGAGPGTCLVWYLTYADDVNIGVSNAGDLEGCFALSNPITVVRQDASICADICEAPSNLRTELVRQRIARLQWDSNKDAIFYQTRHRPVGSTGWFQDLVPQEKVTLRRLSPNTEYEVQVKAYCNIDELSEWSDLLVFTTLPSGNESQAIAHDNEFTSPELNIYPNPAKDEIFVESNLKGDELSIQIYSMSGKIVKDIKVSSDNYRALDLTSMEQGTYIITINNGVEKISKSFIKN